MRRGTPMCVRRAVNTACVRLCVLCMENVSLCMCARLHHEQMISCVSLSHPKPIAAPTHYTYTHKKQHSHEPSTAAGPLSRGAASASNIILPSCTSHTRTRPSVVSTISRQPPTALHKTRCVFCCIRTCVQLFISHMHTPTR